MLTTTRYRYNYYYKTVIIAGTNIETAYILLLLVDNRAIRRDNKMLSGILYYIVDTVLACKNIRMYYYVILLLSSRFLLYC